jgi:hypothetical protein
MRPAWYDRLGRQAEPPCDGRLRQALGQEHLDLIAPRRGDAAGAFVERGDGVEHADELVRFEQGCAPCLLLDPPLTAACGIAIEIAVVDRRIAAKSDLPRFPRATSTRTATGQRPAPRGCEGKAALVGRRSVDVVGRRFLVLDSAATSAPDAPSG